MNVNNAKTQSKWLSAVGQCVGLGGEQGLKLKKEPTEAGSFLLVCLLITALKCALSASLRGRPQWQRPRHSFFQRRLPYHLRQQF